MDRGLTHADIEELLGAFALDAVDPDERAAVERHLASCPRCRAEVAEHREVAAAMANTGAPAPEGLWDRIAGALEEAPPRPTLTALPGGAAPTVTTAAGRQRRPARRRGPVLGALAAAAAVVLAVVGVLGTRLAELEDRYDDLAASMERDALTQAATAALVTPGSKIVDLRSSEGDAVVVAALTPEGQGYLLAQSLPPLADDRTYQLWGRVGEETVSLGVLGARPGVAAFEVEGPVEALAITEEVAGGVARSANPAKVAGELV